MKIAVAVIVSVILVPAVFAQDARTLTANETDQGLTAIEVEGHVGKMRIQSGISTGIRVQVEVKQTTSDRRLRGNPQGVDLRSSRNGSTLEIRLSGDHQDLEENWIIEIPAHLAVEPKLGVGDLEVLGVRGGIKAKVGVGRVKIDVPEGNIDAESGVGEVSVKSATASYGNIDLRANVGSAKASIDGREIRQQNRPPGPSERITFNGSGRDRFQIQSGVGNAELTIGR